MRRTIWIPQELWDSAITAALSVSLQEGRRVSVAELIRRGLEQQIAAALGKEATDA